MLALAHERAEVDRSTPPGAERTSARPRSTCRTRRDRPARTRTATGARRQCRPCRPDVRRRRGSALRSRHGWRAKVRRSTTDSGIEVRPALHGRRPRRLGRRRAARPAGRSRRTPAASTRRCTGAGSGRCASTPASAPPSRPTSGSSSCSRAGQTGLSCAFDLPTQMGYDSDHPRAEGEVGKVGVAIDSIDDMRLLLDGIPLDKVTTSMTINSTAAILLLLYELVAEEQGVAADAIGGGTIQNDLLKEYIARGHVHVPAPAVDADHHRHLRLLPRAHPPVEHHLDLRLPHPRGRLDGGAGDRLHPRQRHRLRPGGDRRRARRRRVRPPAVVLLERPQQLLRGGGQVPGRPAHVVPDHDRALRRPERGAPSCCASTPRPAARRSPRSSPRTTSCGSRVQAHGRGAGRHAEPAHQRLRRGARPADRAGGPHRPAHAADRRLRERRRRHARPAGRVVLRRVAHRRGRAAGVGVHRADRRARAARWPPSRPATRWTRSSRPPTSTPSRSTTASGSSSASTGSSSRTSAEPEVFPIDPELQRRQVERVRRFKAERDQADGRPPPRRRAGRGPGHAEPARARCGRRWPGHARWAR